jgi:hypothetical protein
MKIITVTISVPDREYNHAHNTAVGITDCEVYFILQDKIEEICKSYFGSECIRAIVREVKGVE